MTPTKRPKNVDRVPPNSLEAEQCVLGSILIDHDACFSQVAAVVKDPSWFYDLRNSLVWSAMLKVVASGLKIDPITLLQSLKDEETQDKVGGAAYLTLLTESVPSTANLPDWLEVLRAKFTLREVIQKCSSLVGDAYESDSVSSVLNKLVNVASDHIAGRDSSGIRQADAKSAVRMALEKIEWRVEHPNKMSGIATGYRDLDRLTDGLQPGELILVCARPSQGKSAAILNLVDNICLQNSVPTLVFSLEMSIRAMTTRLLCSHQRVDSMAMRRGELDQEQIQKVQKFAGKMSKVPLHFYESSSMGINQLCRIARDVKRKHDIKCIAVDYMQIVKPSEKNEKKTYEVATVSNGLKELAKELDVPVIVACQLNREIEKDRGRMPRLSDIGDSGQIERDADVAIMIHHLPEQANPEETSECRWIVAKQREGPTDSIPMVYLKRFTRFESRSFMESAASFSR